MTKGDYMQDDNERLMKFANEWRNNKKPVTRASYRNMALNLYFDLYIF